MARRRTTRLVETAPAPVAEADAPPFEDITAQISAMLSDAMKPSAMTMAAPCDDYPYIKATYADHVIVCKGAELYQLPYSVDANGDITLGKPQEVVVAYQPVANDTPDQEQAEDGSAAAALAAMEASARLASARSDADPAAAGAPVELHESSRIIESTDARGASWDVLLIKAGLSGNRRYYPAAMLEASVPLFEGVKAYADHPSKDELRSRPERSIRDVVGWFESVRYDAAEEGIRGTFKVLESADWLRATLKSAWDQGKRDLLGFSINAMGTASNQRRADGSTLIEAFDRVISTDVVTTPGAGGRLLGVLESERESEDEMLTKEEIEAIVRESLAASTTSLMEAVKVQIAEALPKPAAPITEGAVIDAKSEPVSEIVEMREALAEIKRGNRQLAIGARVDAAKLPTAHALKVKTRLLEAAARREVDDAEVDGEIQFVRDLIAESGPARPAWSGSVSMGDDTHDKQRKALIGWFEGKEIDGVRPVRDLRESYALWEGVNYLDVSPIQFFRAFSGGYDSEGDHRKITEALTQADWNQVFADVFYLQMIASYQNSPDYDKWRNFVSEVEGPSDFRTRHWARIGGYGDLSSVAELGTYPDLTSPGDEEQTYSLSKYGGIDSISMEMVLGDRLAQVRRMPQLMAYAAARTLYKFVLNLVTTTNPTMGYDSVALYAAGHSNTGTTALSVSALDTVNVAMRNQTAYGASQEILGSRNRPRRIVIPNTLESLAQRVLMPSDTYYASVSNAGTDVTMDPQRWKNAGIEYHVFDQLTDTNDWFTVADPAMMPTMVVGFLNGRQDPELFTQDQPNVGSTFSADRISYKVRHVFGGAILDHRAFYRMVV